MKQLLDKCPICGKGNISLKTIDEFIKVGNNTAVLKVKVEACDRCGENYYDPDTIREIEFVRKELKNKFPSPNQNVRIATLKQPMISLYGAKIEIWIIYLLH